MHQQAIREDVVSNTNRLNGLSASQQEATPKGSVFELPVKAVYDRDSSCSMSVPRRTPSEASTGARIVWKPQDSFTATLKHDDAGQTHLPDGFIVDLIDVQSDSTAKPFKIGGKPVRTMQLCCAVKSALVAVGVDPTYVYSTDKGVWMGLSTLNEMGAALTSKTLDARADDYRADKNAANAQYDAFARVFANALGIREEKQDLGRG